MSDEQGKKVKDGVKKGISVVGKVVKWVLISILIITVAVIAYSCYTCTAVTKAVVDATADSGIVKDTKSGSTKTSGSSAKVGSEKKTSNKEPTKITIEDPRDIPFLHNDSRIKAGETYEITVDAWFSQLSGTMLILAIKGDQWTADTFSVTTNSRIPDFERATPVRAVFLYKPGSFAKESSFMNTELVSIEKR